ncbi:hypothetical protein ACLESD_14060 [Pyxidicoccus sp. 3LFB2]
MTSKLVKRALLVGTLLSVSLVGGGCKQAASPDTSGAHGSVSASPRTGTARGASASSLSRSSGSARVRARTVNGAPGEPAMAPAPGEV